MKRKILHFDGGGDVDYDESWAELIPENSQEQESHQTIFPVDGGALQTLDQMPAEAWAHLIPVNSQADNPEQTISPTDGSAPHTMGYLPASKAATDYGPKEEGVFTKILKGMGIAGKDGNVDLSNSNTLDKLLKVLSIGGSMVSTLQGPQGKKSPQELQAALKGPFDSFQGPAAAAANNYFNTPLKSRTLQYNRSGASLVPTQRYAEGGEVNDNKPEFFSPGALSAHYISGGTGGQADQVPARVAHGEYIFDADTVSNIGDGNNEAGAHILDSWREKLREQKRSAPSHKIPPKFKGVQAYMPKGEK